MGQHSKDADLPLASARVPAGKSLSRWETAESPCLPQAEQVWITSLQAACQHFGMLQELGVFVKSWSWPMGNGDIRKGHKQGRQMGSWG